MRIEVSEAANADLDGIYDYGAEWFGEAAADEYLRRFDSVYALLAEHLQIGPVHEGVRPAIRSFPCGRHRLYYDVADDCVIVRRSASGDGCAAASLARPARDRVHR